VVLGSWKAYTPAVREAALAALTRRPAGASALLAALEDGCVPPADVPPAARQALRGLPDEALRGRAEALFAASAAPRQEVVERYVAEVAGLAGDPGRGRAVFERVCATCHRVQGIGVEVGADLANVTDRSPAAWLAGILDPNRAMEGQYAEYVVETTDGRVLSGRIAAETANSVTLRGAEGREDVLLRSEIEGIAGTGRSLMPEGIEKDIAPGEMADLVAFLNRTEPPPKQFDGNAPRAVGPEPDGRIRLFAGSAAIHGSTLVFERKYRNLGYWSSEDDRARWTLEGVAGGRYEVWLHYAGAPGAGGRARLAVDGGAALTAQVDPTDSWDDYVARRVGTLEVPAGRCVLEVRSDGPIGSALMDLATVELRPAVGGQATAECCDPAP
jgi:putative heme-binding domain-containing protein